MPPEALQQMDARSKEYEHSLYFSPAKTLSISVDLMSFGKSVDCMDFLHYC